MLLLAIDTSTRRGSVALRRQGSPLGEVRRELDGGHSGWILDAAQGLLRDAGHGPDDLEGLAVVRGPGSFTGLRVGLATVQGLALPRGLPCLGVSTLDVLAWKVRGAAGRLFAVMDAWRSEVYAREYDGRGEPRGEPEVTSPAALARRIGSGECAVFGDGALAYRGVLEAGCPRAAFPARSLFLAATLAELAEPRLEEGQGGPGSELRPLYLRAPALRAPRP